MSQHRGNGRVGVGSGRGSADSALLTRAVIVIGALRTVAGIGAWMTVRSQLAAERIVIPGADTRLHGRRVAGPVTAFVEASVIKQLALSATGGRTYGELPEGDPAAETAMNASLLRSSLFTSVLAFGTAAAEVATGVALLAVGSALGRITKRLDGAAS